MAVRTARVGVSVRFCWKFYTTEASHRSSGSRAFHVEGRRAKAYTNPLDNLFVFRADRTHVEVCNIRACRVALPHDEAVVFLDILHREVGKPKLGNGSRSMPTIQEFDKVANLFFRSRNTAAAMVPRRRGSSPSPARERSASLRTVST